MNLKFNIFIILIINMIIISTGYAQDPFWIETNGPPVASVVDMINDRSGNFIIATGRVHKFDREDNSWIHISSAIDSVGVLVLELTDSGRLIAGGPNGHVFYSDDLGTTWYKSNIDTSFSTSPAPSVTFIAAIKDSILIAVYGPLIFRSTDNGENWYHLSIIIPFISFTRNSFILPNGDILIGGNKVYRSNDLGESWAISDSGMQFGGIRDFILTQEGSLLATSSLTLYRSNDDGYYWEEVSPDLFRSDFTTLVSDSAGNLLTINGSGETFVSEDHGNTWIEISVNPAIYYPNSIVIDENERIYVGSSFTGVFESDDFGISWAVTNNGLNRALVDVVKARPNNKIYAGAYRTGVFISDDKGETWNHIFRGDPSYIYDITDDELGNVYLATESGLLISKDGGDTWHLGDSTIFNGWFHSILYLGDGKLLGGSGIGRIYRSSDYGDTWQQVLKLNEGIATALDINQKNEIFAVIGPRGIFKSVDEGQTWQELNDALAGLVIRGFDINHNGDLYVGVSEGNIFKLTEGDSIWIEIYSDSSHFSLRDIMVDQFNNVYASFSDGDPIVSHNGGRDWEDLDLSPLNIKYLVRDFAIDNDNFLYAALYGQGIIRSTHAIIFVEQRELNSIVPKSHRLLQNYPNPFNPVTKIEFDIPLSGEVNLTVYNLRGSEIIRLIEGVQQAGYYTVTWNASNVASGIYFYQLQAGDFVQTKKMVLLK